MTNIRTITIDNLKDGFVNELFIDALGRILENVADKATDRKKRREIVIRIGLDILDEERSKLNCSISCEPKFAPYEPVSTAIAIGYDRQRDGKMVPFAYEIDAANQDQLSLLSPSALIDGSK